MTLLVAGATGQPPSVLDLSTTENPAALASQVWESSPDLQAARGRIAAARADLARAHFLPNPGLDVSLNTIPVGPTNPGDLRDPILNVPNVGVALSILLEVGKRAPRQDAAHQTLRSTVLDVLEQVRQKVLAVEEAIAEVAAAEVRVATLIELAADATQLTKLQRQRSEKGDTSPLDADRAQLDEESTITELGEARAGLEEALRTCSELVGLPCLPFGDRARAAAWLERTFDSTTQDFTRRPDVQSLDAARASAEANQLLASRRWAPDPTLRVGYVHDRFVVSGNQQNSLYVGLSFPLPFFDHGQADEEAAAVAAASAKRARERLIAISGTQLERIDAEQKTVDGRITRLRELSLPLAQSVVERLQAAVNRGAAPIQELLLARRSRAELLLTANDLDKASFRLRVARARVTGGGLTYPKELTDAP
jgi:cobalt-zinc-cadmium efflux system outer membrane protein